MSGKVVTIEPSVAPPWRLRPLALAAVGLARLLERLPPRRLRRVLELASRGARPADTTTAWRARNAVVAVSIRCAGPRCLQRSIATVLLCRAGGSWPDWCTGVRTQPFQAHAWVAVDGVPVGENINDIRYFHRTMTVKVRS
ncbi:lasso peptide biosynthesis B2 protein [Plantactinospora sonchi]|uniref:Lasso peptide biosynthesis B2 protein n=1 Tax=Plantactinospora sonchi TaxID=1544735 RepID=A0ABU7S421_9ACTN